MKIEIGESLVRSWLRHVERCEFAELNWKPSPTWQTEPDNEVTALFERAKKDNPEAIGQNALSQFLRQAEIDVLGLSTFSDKLHLIDIAFHSKGLDYGSKRETGQRVYKKLVRSALIAKTYFQGRDAIIYFVTPKATPAIATEVSEACEHVKELFANETNIKFELIMGSDFKTQLVDEVLALGGEVADTSELFLRSWQLIKPFIDLANDQQPETTVTPDDADSEDQVVSEINKVANRITGWANNPNQINARILKSFLTLKREVGGRVTVEMLETEYGDANFSTNFTQMKTISARNHGKVFEVNGNLVEIWPPVFSHVQEFEERVMTVI